jgi:RNA polymerase sigma factor (sigma-70 family)
MSTDLLGRAQRGDRDALVALLKLHDADVRSVIERRLPPDCRSLLGVDDVLQDAYFDAVQGIRGFSRRDERSFPAWLTCIALRKLAVAVRALRTAKRRGNGRPILPRSPDSEISLLEHLTQLATHSTPSHCVSREETLQQLRRAIAQLPPQYQTVTRRHDLEGAAMSEVASELGRSVGAAYLLRVRAIDALRARLMEHLSKF